MSSLTNLFTSLANKIRSKTGSEATMTPYEMVDAIDDVYDEGVAHGQTPTQTKSVTATTAAQTVTPDSGYALSSVTVNPQVHSGTYTPSSRSAALDMGVYNNVRYVNTNSVPNTNSGTYTYPWSGGETVDLGAANTYRYVNAQSVYSAGYSNGYNDGKYVVPGANTVKEIYISNGQASNTADVTYVAPGKGLIVAGFMYSNSSGAFGQLEYNGAVRAWMGGNQYVYLYVDAWVVNAGDVIRAYAYGVKGNSSNASACAVIRFISY